MPRVTTADSPRPLRHVAPRERGSGAAPTRWREVVREPGVPRAERGRDGEHAEARGERERREQGREEEEGERAYAIIAEEPRNAEELDARVRLLGARGRMRPCPHSLRHGCALELSPAPIAVGRADLRRSLVERHVRARR